MVVKKSPSKSSGHRKTLLLGIAALVLIASGVIIYHVSHIHNDSAHITRTSAYDNSKKKAVINNGGVPVGDGNVSNSKGSTPSGSYTPPTTNNGITITPSISGNDVIVATKLVGYSDGTCTLNVTNGSKATTQSAAVIFAPDFSNCAGFTVPIKTLGAGSWNIALHVTSDGTTTSKATAYEVP